MAPVVNDVVDEQNGAAGRPPAPRRELEAGRVRKPRAARSTALRAPPAAAQQPGAELEAEP